MPKGIPMQVYEGLSPEGQREMDSATPEHRTFALELVKGRTAADAFRAAYPVIAANSKSETIWTEASRLKASPKVSLWVRAFSMTGAGGQARTLGHHVSRLTELSYASESVGNYSSAVMAEISAGKASGLYIDKIQDLTERPDPGEALANILGESITEKLKAKQRLEIEQDEE